MTAGTGFIFTYSRLLNLSKCGGSLLKRNIQRARTSSEVFESSIIGDELRNLNSEKGVLHKQWKKNTAEVISYLDSAQHLQQIKYEIPSRLFMKNLFPPGSIHLIDSQVAGDIMNHIRPFIEQDPSIPVIEAHPSFGLLTSKLLETGVTNLQLHEPVPYFHHYMSVLISRSYPDSNKIKMRVENIMEMGKLVFQDQVDGGKRVADIMQGIEPVPWDAEQPTFRLIGATRHNNFLRNMIHGVTFQKGFASYGRTEYFLLLHPITYLKLTCQPNDPYFNYRYSTALFQILFESSLLTKVPRAAFLPWERESNSVLKKWKEMYPDETKCLYLVRVIPRRDLLQRFTPEQLQTLWYFIMVNFARKNKIIPTFERWIPNCGSRLIRQGLTLFTEFQDLTPAQLLRLYSLFISWPEFESSSFLTAMEVSILKSAPTGMYEQEVPPEPKETPEEVGSPGESMGTTETVGEDLGKSPFRE